ncbi:MAG: hypothetical protein ABSG01_08925 [Anaerolineales bacterium]|jgi:hypothetical protein
MPNINTNSGTKAMRKIQLGVETTPGTPVVATALWRGVGVAEDSRLISFPKEDIGVAPGVDRSYLASLGGKINLAPIEETFEQGPYLFEMGCKKLGTGVADGGGTGKIYTYPFWSTPANKLTQSLLGIRTVEAGDDMGLEIMEFAYADSIVLDAKGDGGWMMSGTLMGRQLTAGLAVTATTISFDASHHILDSGNGLAGFATPIIIKVIGSNLNDGIYTVTTTAAGQLTVTETTVTESAGNTITIIKYFTGGPAGLAVPTVEDIAFGGTKLFVDPVGGTLGATQVTNSLLSCTVTIKTGIVGKDTGDGVYYFSHLEFVPEDITVKMSFLYNGNAQGERANFRSQTPRLIRVQSQGSALTTPGAYSYKTRNIDLAGKWDKFDPIGEQNGSDIISGSFHAKYNATAAKYCVVTYVNQLASLP